MITPTMIYFIGILDSISSFFRTVSTGLIVVIFLGVVFSPMLDDIDIVSFAKMKGFLAKCIVALCIFGTLAAFTPSSKLAAMYIIPAVANNENVKAIGSNSLEALRKLTEQWLLELNGKDEPEKGERSL